jgi:hypothetical protein
VNSPTRYTKSVLQNEVAEERERDERIDRLAQRRVTRSRTVTVGGEIVGGDGRRGERRTKFQFIFPPIVTSDFEDRFLSSPLHSPSVVYFFLLICGACPKKRMREMRVAQIQIKSMWTFKRKIERLNLNYLIHILYE